MKKKLDSIRNIVRGKFFTVERKVRNKTERYCAKFVSESSQYMTIHDVNRGKDVKMNKNTITALNCGSVAM